MTQRTRKFIGVWLLIGWLVIYPIGVAIFYASFLMALPVWPSIGVFLVLGLAWAVPAAWIIRWMVAPEKGASS